MKIKGFLIGMNAVMLLCMTTVFAADSTSISLPNVNTTNMKTVAAATPAPAPAPARSIKSYTSNVPVSFLTQTTLSVSQMSRTCGQKFSGYQYLNHRTSRRSLTITYHVNCF